MFMPDVVRKLPLIKKTCPNDRSCFFTLIYFKNFVYNFFCDGHKVYAAILQQQKSKRQLMIFIKENLYLT